LSLDVILPNFNIYQPTINNQGFRQETNDNGRRLVNFAAFRNMVIGRTMFEHNHKITRSSPDGHYFNQIDHILIDSRHISELVDVRTFRGASIDSDYLGADLFS
jgi:hypothetical protein